MSSICLSVCLSVTFRYADHIRWNISKIISRLISLRFLIGLIPTPAIWSDRNIPKIWVKWGGDHFLSIKPAISLKWCKIGPKLSRRSNRKSHTRFRLVYQNQWPWMTLNGRCAVQHGYLITLALLVGHHHHHQFIIIYLPKVSSNNE